MFFFLFGLKCAPCYIALISKAEDLLSRYEFELARKFYQRALEQDPQNVQAMCGIGEGEQTQRSFHLLVQDITHSSN